MLLSLHATLSDPGSPSESHHNDSPVLASGTLTPSPTASVAANGAESLRGGTSPLRPAMFSVYASPVLFAPDHPGLRNRRNTRYGLLVKLYPMGTYTPKEAPSCAWRTSAFSHMEPPFFPKGITVGLRKMRSSLLASERASVLKSHPISGILLSHGIPSDVTPLSSL